MAARLRAVPDTRTHLRPVATPDAPQAPYRAVDASRAPQAERARRSATQAALGRLGVTPDSRLGVLLTAALGDVWRAGVVHGHQAALEDAAPRGAS